MTNTMSMTDAIREASSLVGAPQRRSATDWVFYAPYRAADTSGPRTEVQACSYAASRAKRATRVAEVALALMGKLDAESRAEVFDDLRTRSVEEMVRAGLKAYGTGPTAEELGFAASQY